MVADLREMQENQGVLESWIDKRESTVLIPSASNLLFLPQTSHVLEVI